jgi:hypothetical protein
MKLYQALMDSGNGGKDFSSVYELYKAKDQTFKP